MPGRPAGTQTEQLKSPFNSARRTLEISEALNLTDTVSMDGLAIDQIVHVTCTEGTTDATSVEVTQEPPPVAAAAAPALTADG